MDKITKKKIATNNELKRSIEKPVIMPVICKSYEALCRKTILDFDTTEGRSPVFSQLVRSCNSVAANVMESLGHKGQQKEIMFLRNARGSALECLAHSRILDYKVEQYSELAKKLDKYIVAVLD